MNHDGPYANKPQNRIKQRTRGPICQIDRGDVVGPDETQRIDALTKGVKSEIKFQGHCGAAGE